MESILKEVIVNGVVKEKKILAGSYYTWYVVGDKAYLIKPQEGITHKVIHTSYSKLLLEGIS